MSACVRRSELVLECRETGDWTLRDHRNTVHVWGLPLALSSPVDPETLSRNLIYHVHYDDIILAHLKTSIRCVISFLPGCVLDGIQILIYLKVRSGKLTIHSEDPFWTSISSDAVLSEAVGHVAWTPTAGIAKGLVSL